MTRRFFLSLLSKSVPGAGLLAAGAGTYAVALEPSWIEVRRVGIPVRGLPPTLDGLRVVHISDIHRSDLVSGHYVTEAVQMALALAPELVALTGDFITASPEGFDQLARELAPLGAAAPTFAVPGNHDYVQLFRWMKPALPLGAEQLSETLARAGVEVLRNERRLAPVRGGAGAVELVGLDDLWSGHFDAQRAFGSDQPEAPRLVLCHNPDAFRSISRRPFDLLLAGHTHGGQVRLPFLGAPLSPVEDRRFLAGLVTAENRRVYVNRGLGYNRRIRFGVRPEITLLTLASA